MSQLATSNGHGADAAPGGGVGRGGPMTRRRATVILVVLAALVGTAEATGYLRDRGWVRIGTVEQLDRSRIVYVSNLRLFVVGRGAHPLALSAVGPSGAERLLFCRSSGYFQSPTGGDAFDRFGRYASGPSPRGMSVVAVRVTGNFVDVKPSDVSPGLPRFRPAPQPAAGAPCAETAGEAPAGFYAEAS